MWQIEIPASPRFSPHVISALCTETGNYPMGLARSIKQPWKNKAIIKFPV